MQGVQGTPAEGKHVLVLKLHPEKVCPHCHLTRGEGPVVYISDPFLLLPAQMLTCTGLCLFLSRHTPRAGEGG